MSADSQGAYRMDITVTPTRLDGVLVIDTAFFIDERGFFIESYHKAAYQAHGISVEFVQDNHSRSAHKVLRGLHYQDLSAPMGKLIRCTFGQIFDVAVDLRVSSPTFGQWFGIELSAANMTQIWIPPGFAHGFATLSEFAEVQYKCSNFYTPAAEGAISWNDPDIAIDWPFSDPTLSKRDLNAMSLRAYRESPAFP
jgi:dTDP-4-dehydrorhamnose 3,5-epimerase